MGSMSQWRQLFAATPIKERRPTSASSVSRGDSFNFVRDDACREAVVAFEVVLVASDAMSHNVVSSRRLARQCDDSAVLENDEDSVQVGRKKDVVVESFEQVQVEIVGFYVV
jgi:hypothetical protein